MELFRGKRIPYGLYRVYWDDGSTSVAAIGGTEAGNYWIAPANWVTVPAILWQYEPQIDRLELIEAA